MAVSILVYISGKKISQTEDLYRNTVNNINLYYKTNSGKTNDQFLL